MEDKVAARTSWQSCDITTQTFHCSTPGMGSLWEKSQENDFWSVLLEGFLANLLTNHKPGLSDHSSFRVNLK